MELLLELPTLFDFHESKDLKVLVSIAEVVQDKTPPIVHSVTIELQTNYIQAIYSFLPSQLFTLQ